MGNSAGPADGFFNPQMKSWSTFHYFCAPWKVLPATTATIVKLFTEDVASFWFRADDRKERSKRADDRKDTVDLKVKDRNEKPKCSRHALHHKASEKALELQLRADPDRFPPKFVQNRLAQFESAEWAEMHRGFNLYHDFLADYWAVIHNEFVVKLSDGGHLCPDALERMVQYLDHEGFRGLADCHRDGGYLHILSAFLWLNVVH